MVIHDERLRHRSAAEAGLSLDGTAGFNWVVVRDDHACEPSLGERERFTVLEVDLDHLDSIMFPDVIETRGVSIDGNDVVALVQEPACVATCAAGDVEHRTSARDHGCEADDPR